MLYKALREILQFQSRTLGSKKFDIIFKKRARPKGLGNDTIELLSVSAKSMCS